MLLLGEDQTNPLNQTMPTHRLDKVNELLKREIGSYVQREFEWPGTIGSILDVEVTEDLREARVWVGVVGKMTAGSVVEKLSRYRGMIQGALARRVVLRHTPKLSFRHDDSAQRGVDMVNLLDDIEKNLPKAPRLPEGESDPEI